MVRDASVHREVIEKVLDFAESVGFSVEGLDFSPIKGPEGNIEYLIFLEKDSLENDISQKARWHDEAVRVVEEAHKCLK